MERIWNSTGRCGWRRDSKVVLLLAAWSLTAGVTPAFMFAQTPGAPAPTAADTAASPSTPEPLWTWDPSDPRIELAAGVHDAGEAARGMERIVSLPLPEGFSTNSDIAFSGVHAFVGNYNGFNVYDITDPSRPNLRLSVLCPGNQGDLSVYGSLLFKSVQATSSRVDCGAEGVADSVSVERFRGVRIFDITDVANPRQVAAVQTCRGSHTHSLASSPSDPDHVYVYVSGTSAPRSGLELAGCSGLDPEEDPNTSLFRIEVIQVPLARPQDARVVNEPRVFADPITGDIAGLWPGGTHGPGTQRSSRTASCHDITTYPAIGLGGGACQGNGILFDIADPTNPVRVHDVVDPNFSYWHSATFNNDGTKVIFTDEWGGGTAARCRDIDPPTWGGNAIFTIVDGKLRLEGYYKLPVPQSSLENCVAHNGSLIPVPGRDIKVQAWYQGGISIFDFTDPADPYEVAFFDRGPLNAERMRGGGFWSAYWYNGYIYGSEMVRGLDVFRLVPSEHLSANEIEAAMSVRLDHFNAQHQPKLEWPVSYPVARSYVDQLERAGALGGAQLSRLREQLDRAQRSSSRGDRRNSAEQLVERAGELEAEALEGLAAGRMGNADRTRALLARSLRDLAEALR